MRIVFGWYSFTIKSYTPEELNIRNEKNESFNFEVRQKCFQLFWIPFFSLGKSYVVNKNGKRYKVPFEIETLIKSKGEVKTPFYTYSIPLLMALGLVIFLGYVIQNEIPQYRYERFLRAKYNHAVDQLDVELTSLTPNHYIKILNLEECYSSRGTFLKVAEKKKDSVVFYIVETDILEHDAYPYELTDYFKKNVQHLNKVTLAIKDLKKAVCHDVDAYWQREKFGEFLLGDGNRYLVEDIINNDGPVIKGVESTYGPLVWDVDKWTWDGGVKFHNYGVPVKLTEIENLEGTINWSNQLPMNIETDSTNKDFFVLNGTNYVADLKYKIRLTFVDSASKVYHYEVVGKNWDKTIERVIE